MKVIKNNDDDNNNNDNKSDNKVNFSLLPAMKARGRSRLNV